MPKAKQAPLDPKAFSTADKELLQDAIGKLREIQESFDGELTEAAQKELGGDFIGLTSIFEGIIARLENAVE